MGVGGLRQQPWSFRSLVASLSPAFPVLKHPTWQLPSIKGESKATAHLCALKLHQLPPNAALTCAEYVKVAGHYKRNHNIRAGTCTCIVRRSWWLVTVA